MSETLTVPYYLRVSKTLAERLSRHAQSSVMTKEQAIESLLRLGLLIHAMPDGATVIRRRGQILGISTENVYAQRVGGKSDMANSIPEEVEGVTSDDF